LILRGKVKSGFNSLSYWMDRLEKYYTEKTGMMLYPGSLNIELPEPYVLPNDVIRLEKEEYGGTVSLSILPCQIFGRKAFIIRTDKNASGMGDHPLNIIEIAADVKLRDEYDLIDGDVVEICINK
jgi:riboflavin kinase